VAKDPAFLFYSSDFMIGIAFMSNEQAGKYIKLLCFQHQFGHLTEEQMMAVTRDRDHVIFSKFNIDSDGLYYNIRLDNEVMKRKAYSVSRSKNRKHMNNICQSYDEHMENENRNENIITNTTKRTTKPTVEEVKTYCQERRNKVDSDKFHAYYEANGWVQGKNKPIKDWKAAVRTWEKNTFNKDGPSPVDNVPRKPPDKDCRECYGSGLIYAIGSGKNSPCYCTKIKD
jgi:hypothetical protein